jgi:hypothetical protein
MARGRIRYTLTSVRATLQQSIDLAWSRRAIGMSMVFPKTVGGPTVKAAHGAPCTALDRRDNPVVAMP